MLFKHTDHTKKYFNKCHILLSEFFQINWKSISTFDIDFNNGDSDLKYKFLKISSKPFTKVEKTESIKINQFLSDLNILSCGIIELKPHSKVQIHKDHDYWIHPFYRIHIPLNSTGAFFIYDDEKIVWEREKVYIFDVMNIEHGAENATDEVFEMLYVDISQKFIEKNSKINPSVDKIKNYFLENVNQEVILKFHNQTCTEQEMLAEKKYLQDFKRNLKMK